MVRGEPYRELIIVTSGKGRSVPEEDGTMSPRADATQSGVVKDLAAAIEYVEGSFFGELVRTILCCLFDCVNSLCCCAFSKLCYA